MSKIESVMDLDEALARANDKPAIARLTYDLFIDALPEERRKITESRTTGDYEKLRFDTHKLCGAAIYSAFTAIRDAARGLESAILAGESERMEAHIDVLLDEIDLALDASGEGNPFADG